MTRSTRFECPWFEGIAKLAWLVAGTGSGLAEGPVFGVRPVTLDCRVVPCALPGLPLALSLVGDHAGIDDIGEPSFECAHGLHRSFPGCFFGIEEGAAFGGIAQLHDGHDVQDTVDSAIPGSG